MTTSQGTNNQQYQSQSQPWAPTQGALTNLVNNLGGVNYAPTTAQNAATSGLVGSAQAIPNFGPTVGNVASGYLNGQNNTGVANAAGAATNALSPYLDPNYTNPYNNPAESALSNQIISQVNGTFAGSGRDSSPANYQADVAGLAPTLFNQYNANVQQQQNAANSLFNVANQANNAYLQNAGFGVNTAGLTPGAYTAPGTAQVGAANTQYGLPLQNVSGLENLLLPIAGLGGQTQGTQNTQTTQTMSPEQAMLMPFIGGSNNAFSGITGAMGSGFNYLNNIFAPNMNWGGNQ